MLPKVYLLSQPSLDLIENVDIDMLMGMERSSKEFQKCLNNICSKVK